MLQTSFSKPMYNNYPPFKGDLFVLRALSSTGLSYKDAFINKDLFLTRPDINPEIIVNKLIDTSNQQTHNILIQGKPSSGKSTLMMKLKNLIESKGIKTFVFDGDPINTREIYSSINQSDNNTPIIIFIDEFQDLCRLENFDSIISFQKINKNIKIVATTYEDNALFSYIFPDKDCIKLSHAQDQIIPKINNALEFANFSTLPKKISDKLKLILQDHPILTFRAVLRELIPLMENDKNRIDDMNKMEKIDIKIWQEMLNRLDDKHLEDTITLKKNKSVFGLHQLTHYWRMLTHIF